MVQVNLSDTFEESWVEAYVVGMLGQQGLHLLRQGIHLVVGLGTQQVEEYRRHA